MRLNGYLRNITGSLLFTCVVGWSSEPVTSLYLELENAGRTGGYAEIGFPSYLNMTKVGDTWYPVGGRTEKNKGILWGHVESATVTDHSVDISLSYFMPTDKFVNGGRGTYTISCTRSSDGTLEGTYEGIYYGETYTFWWMPKTAENHLCSLSVCGQNAPSPPRGTVRGRITERASPHESFTPPGRREHPRILFRESDLPLLKAKSETPFGKKCLELMQGWGAVGHGVLHQIAKYSGDDGKAAQYAHSAAQLVRFHMKDFSNGEDEHGQVAWTRRLEQVSMAYDLCYDAWSPEFRHEVAWYLVNTSKTILNFHSDWVGSNFDWTIDAYAVGWYSGIGFAGMALYGETTPEVPFFPWFGDDKRAPTIEPDSTLTLPEGVTKTVLTFRDADDINMVKEPGTGGIVSLPNYLCATGIMAPKDSLLAPFGNDRTYRPALEESIVYGDTQSVWRKIPSEHLSSVSTLRSTYEALELSGLTSNGDYTVLYLFAVVENTKPRWVEFQDNLYLVKNSSRLESEMYINGVLRRPGDYMYLKEGLYAVLIAVPTFHFQAWGETNYAPRLVEPGYAGYGRRETNLTYLDYEKAQREAYADRVATIIDGNPFFSSLLFRGAGALCEFFELTRSRGREFPRGRHGLEAPRNETDNPAAKFGTALQNMFNIPADPLGDVTEGIIEMFEEGEIPMHNVSYLGRANPAMPTHAYGLLSDSLRTAFKGKWMEMVGVTDEDNAEELIRHDPVYALLNFPLEVDVSTQPSSSRVPSTRRPTLNLIHGPRGTTVIEYFVPRGTGATIRLYGVSGRLLATPVSGKLPTGTHRLRLNTPSKGSRTCIVSFETSDGESIRKNVTLIR